MSSDKLILLVSSCGVGLAVAIQVTLLDLVASESKPLLEVVDSSRSVVLLVEIVSVLLVKSDLEGRVIVNIEDENGLRLAVAATGRCCFGVLVVVEEDCNDEETDEKIMGDLLRFNRV